MSTAGGPAVVAIGGGHGLSTSIRAARRYAGRVTAIVSVADDGGSSGRLRQDLGIAAPGDIRRCLVAMGDPDSLWGQAFEHRFDAGDLKGHALGNVVIAGLAGVTGDFLAALDEAARLVGVGDTCRVLPATATPVVLEAEDEAGTVQGQMQVSTAATGRIRTVSISPPDAAPPPAAIRAIEEADQVVVGPGSLFSSVLAAVAPAALRDALAASRAQCVYVCNLDTQDQETVGYDAADHVEALLAHGVRLDAVLCDPRFAPEHEIPVRVHVRAVARDDGRAHDADRLAGALRDLLG
ncbi:MAG TPA: uridine diphosphate-N-acetylglucosamine-binding protein YvcK [Acidimicrobiales bacterium]|nr:uridine diphosphate-N-acetylglucosamine-binding protein YvcK [Acidimicrobiales bacterium]